ncbi:GGDEF domain-containing protein [Solirubrobacter phytolaccae]|uniref:GGDEF domain-containing protein n=1 Tax=Solirubrobacter phytolaccae TaxID=1404360 RepID=A0A9X3NGE7_9ACTN|nr:GGDEF domain-containing protein [Solirubrobacter phytolaccae]MDA0184485.1 GGDEF domain-containing protein [Solirubrobacter phytolaccae]
MGPVSGFLWLAAAAVAIVCRFLPGAPEDHDVAFWALAAFTVGYSLACITRLIPWQKVSIRGHAVAVVLLQPLVALALFVTGGANAYLGPVLVLPMLYVAYFFPLRYAIGLGALEILTYASPIVLSDGPNGLLVHRTVSYAVAYAGLVATIQFLKRRLVEAEREQHHMARVDPLTGLANRRAFDEALACAFETGHVFTVLLIDIDLFKQINDRFGHTTGDRVLRELAAHTSAEVRTGDCLARIGGDEFALVAPGAGDDAAERLREALRDAGARVDAGDGPLNLTVVAAVHPVDGDDRATLLRTLDRRLHTVKDARETYLNVQDV